MKNKNRNFFVSATQIKRTDRFFYKGFRKFCVTNLSWQNDIYYRFGYEAFGIILCGFCKWLIEDLKKQGISQILFFSRDGYIMKEAFERMPDHEMFDAKYIYVSRRSLRVPLLWEKDRASIAEICPTRYISLEDLLVSLGLEPMEYVKLAEKYHYTLQTVVKDSDIEKNEILIKFLDEIWGDITANSKDEYENLKLYLESFNLSERIAVVDIGWRGSMQYFLGKTLESMGKRVHLRGYYITLSSSMKKGLDMHGYLQGVDGNSKGCDLLRGYVGLIETLFLKPDGSVKKYKMDNGRIVPELFACEYIEKDGNYSKEIQAVQNVQKGALQFIEDYISAGLDKNYRFSSETAFTNLSYFSNYPTLKDLEMFADFKFYNGTTTYLAKAEPLGKYVLHPRKLKQDFYGCRWRIGFMKNLFKLPLPYYWLFQVLMKITL